MISQDRTVPQPDRTYKQVDREVGRHRQTCRQAGREAEGRQMDRQAPTVGTYIIEFLGL